MGIKELFLVLLVLCGCVLPATAQLPLPAQPIWVHYSSHDSGLPTELIYKIIADRNGYLWLATDKGLIRYDGKSFRLISTGRLEDFVSVFRTREDVLWLFAFSGRTAAIDLNTQKVIHTDSLYGLDQMEPPTGPYLMGVQTDRELMLYRQGSKGKAVVYPQERKSTFRKMSRMTIVEELLTTHGIPDTLNGLSMKWELDSMFLYNAYGISVKDSFITIRNKIFITAREKAAVLYFNGDDYGISEHVMGFARQGDDLYIGGQVMGLQKITGYFSLPRNKQSIVPLLPHEPVNYIEKDYLDNIWVSSYGNGLFLFPYKDRHTLYYSQEHSGLYSNEITFVRRFPQGLTAIGYKDAVVDFYRPPDASPVRYRLPATRATRAVLQVVNTSRTWLLFTAMEAFYARVNSAGLPDHFRVTPFRKHIGLAPGYKNGGLLNQVFYYASSNGLTQIDSSGTLSWYQGDSGRFLQKRICLLPLADNEFYTGTIRGCYRNTTLLPYLQDAQINSLEKVQDWLFLGTNIGVYTIPLNAVFNADSLQEVYPGPCYTIRHDPAFTYLLGTGELVIVQNSTLKTLARFSFKKYSIPFRLTDFYTDSSYVTLAGNRGVFCIPKQDLIRPALPSVPRIHLLCSLNGYSPADSVYQCRFQKNLSALFELDILDYRSDDWKITYKLFRDGEEIYSQAGIKEGGQINFQPSGPGVYKITYVISADYDPEERIVSYTIIITPLWFQQWWARLLLCLLLALALFYGLYRWYRYKTALERTKLQQKLHLQELEAQSLFGQLKPHFIFNILTPLQGYFIREEKIEGLNYLDSFSQLMRGLLNSIRDKYAPLQSELDFLKNYLQIQEHRFGNCFQYRISTDLHLHPGKYLVPTLLLQPIVENAIEHGIDKTRKDGEIEIRITETERMLVITITDNGAGLPPGFVLSDNHALKIISERMQLLAKMKGTGEFHIGPRPDTQPGTCVTLILAKHFKT